MSYAPPIDEPAKVWVFFDSSNNQKLFPIAMNWRRKLIKFEKLIFIGSHRVGNIRVYDLVCSSETSVYELEYNSNTHVWKVKKVITES